MEIKSNLEDPLNLQWGQSILKAIDGLSMVNPIVVTEIEGYYDEETLDLNVTMSDGRKFELRSYFFTGPPVDHLQLNNHITVEEVGGDKYILDKDKYIEYLDKYSEKVQIMVISMLFYQGRSPYDLDESLIYRKIEHVKE